VKHPEFENVKIIAGLPVKTGKIPVIIKENILDTIAGK
jgi:hypothetical protein